ncbi:DNA-formamidopyrimidine glycosylase family protein [Herbiconiux sp. SYSU D00978]|uniref:DNA-formamidopyrimidine glycosylase family protein n=1 Tax=Herbiconiux sp. SYSU D00978 TaxID=2812562 RepID=UPI001A966C3D|nr:DNA-formamidopyrimidine glycosylase family protein [Herbiconiux sp. SYSU D00978]
MPEGDSVFLLAGRLRPVLDGRALVAGELRSGAAAGTKVGGWRVLGHDTHGKHLLTRFDNGATLHTHMRMQGSWSFTSFGRRVPRRVEQQVRVRLQTDRGDTAWGIDLPVVELLPTEREHDAIGHLGPDPLRADWDAAEAVRRLEARGDRPVNAALLDQRNLAGLGNLWVNELCFLRGLNPWRPIGTVDVPSVVTAAARALRASTQVPGLYQVTTGIARKGESHWVMWRGGKPCRRCGTVIESMDEVPNDPERRHTWWCPHCQPALP